MHYKAKLNKLSKMKHAFIKYKKLVLVTFLCSVAGALVLLYFSGTAIVETDQVQQNSIQKLRTISDHSKVKADLVLQSKTLPMTLEVVNTPPSLAQGLGNRTEIGSDGMLFVFQKPTATSFWMYGMQFDLDLIWIKGDTVTGITESVPAPKSENSQRKPTDRNLPKYPSPGEIDIVLEVPAGFSREQGILPGDRLLIK
jgi:uncharacterized membrane protein (UPF0127 family)